MNLHCHYSNQALNLARLPIPPLRPDTPLPYERTGPEIKPLYRVAAAFSPPRRHGALTSTLKLPFFDISIRLFTLSRYRPSCPSCPSCPSSAWERLPRSSASRPVGEPDAKRSFADVRSQAELGNERTRERGTGRRPLREAHRRKPREPPTNQSWVWNRSFSRFLKSARSRRASRSWSFCTVCELLYPASAAWRSRATARTA